MKKADFLLRLKQIAYFSPNFLTQLNVLETLDIVVRYTLDTFLKASSLTISITAHKAQDYCYNDKNKKSSKFQEKR